MLFQLWLDPLLRSNLPEEYPVDLKHWLASLLFLMAISQLFLVFAPFDWLMRLIKHRWVATSLTALFGAVVLWVKMQSLPTPLPPLLLTVLVAGRIAIGFLMVALYLRGGVLLVWWWTLLLESRHLLSFTGNS